MAQVEELTKQSYELDLEFEKVVLYHCATKERFWSRVGFVIDPDCMGHPLSKLVFESVRQMHKETGRGATAGAVTAQRIRRRVSEGKVTIQELEAFCALLDEVEGFSHMPPVDAVIDELVPVLRRRLQQQAILMGHDDYAKKGDFAAVQAMLEKARALGEMEQVSGVRIGPDSFQIIKDARNYARLKTGVFEIDTVLPGLPRKQMGVLVADSGGGKSMQLMNQFATGLREGLFCGYVTLELPEATQLARLYANLTGLETNKILDNDAELVEAERRMRIVAPHIGMGELSEFSPHATTVKDLIRWIEAKEQERGAKMDLLVVDYGDKLFDPSVRDDNQYVAMRKVYEALRRDIAVERDMWVWTASQASRASKESAKRIDMHHIADSMHKVRVADLVITLTGSEGKTDEIEAFVAKNRTGRSRFGIGPIFTDFDRARMTPAAAEMFDWSKV